jgi:hypothetical protein
VGPARPVGRFPVGLVLLGVLAVPGVSAASDPTGLFVLLFGLPAVILAAIFAALSFPLPRASAVLLVLLLGAHVPLVSWAFDVGYMRSAGGWLWTSLAISIAGLMNAGVRAVFPKLKPSEAPPSEVS